MIHDATVEVTCDSRSCQASAVVRLLPYRGGFRLDDDEVHAEIEQMGWLVTDDGHFCSRDCAGED